LREVGVEVGGIIDELGFGIVGEEGIPMVAGS
jgi:hypothetical protein